MKYAIEYSAVARGTVEGGWPGNRFRQQIIEDFRDLRDQLAEFGLTAAWSTVNEQAYFDRSFVALLARYHPTKADTIVIEMVWARIGEQEPAGVFVAGVHRIDKDQSIIGAMLSGVSIANAHAVM